MEDALLDGETVVPYLQLRGLLPPDAEPQVTVMVGGVSNVVLAVNNGSTRLVVKQALARLDVPDEWLATRERTLVEGAALALAHAITPTRVPYPLDVDEDALVLVIPSAPADWRCLKDDLMDGRVDPAVFVELGRVLAPWHSETSGLTEVTPLCDDQDSFRQLRTDPFHRVIAELHPDLAPTILRCADELERRRDCLVHGDFSPKNILVGDDGLWVIDFEVAHIGAPVFDLAYLLTHLVLKSVHLPAHSGAFQAAATSFLTSYLATLTGADLDPALAPRTDSVIEHLGCVLLARVDGRSRASYLDEPERQTVRTLARWVLNSGPTELDEVWARLGTSAVQR